LVLLEVGPELDGAGAGWSRSLSEPELVGAGHFLKEPELFNKVGAKAGAEPKGDRLHITQAVIAQF